MPPRKGKRGPKKGTKVQKVSEEDVEKTEDTNVVKSDEEPLEEVQVDTGVEVDMEVQVKHELHTEVESQKGRKNKKGKQKEEKMDKDKEEDKGDNETDKNKEEMRVDLEVDVNLDNLDNKERDKEVDREDNRYNELDGQMDDYNIDLDVEGSSPEMLVEPEPVYEEVAQDFTLEEINQSLKDVVDSLLTLSKELEQLEDEEEEGAIKEDEVPFDRFPDVPEPSTVLLLLNLPPELDNNKAVKVFTNQSGLVSNATFVNKTQMRVHFTTQKAATAAKNTLDSLKLYNRKIQVLYAREFVTAQLPSHMNFPYNISPNEFPEKSFNKYQGAKSNYKDFSVPPPPTVGYTGPPQDRYKVVFNRYKLANTTLYKVLMQFYEELSSDSGKERLRWDERKPFYENLLRFDKMYEKTRVSTRYLLLGNMRESFLEDPDRMHDFLAKYTNTTYTHEYVMLPSNYPEQNLDKNKEINLDTNRDNKEMDKMEEDKEVEDEENMKEREEKKWVFLVFDKNRDASVFYTKFSNSIKFFKEKMDNGGGEKEDPDGLGDMLIKYSCPLHALDTLWIGNVTDLCAYFAGEDEFYSFFSSLGTIKYFKLVYESSCMFVTFQDTLTSTKVYNFLNSMSPKRLVRLYNLRNKNRMNLSRQDNNKENNLEHKMDMDNTYSLENKEKDNEREGGNRDNKERENKETEDFLEVEKTDDLLNVDFSVGKSDNSYVLGQKLLNAIKRRSDSKELIENLLNTKEYSHFSRDPDYLTPRNGRGYRREYPEVWRRERGRFDRRFREPYSRDGYRDNNRYNSRDEGYNRDQYERDGGRYSRDEGYGRDMFGRDGRGSNREYRGRDDGYRDNNREYNRFRQRYPINKESRVDKFGRTIRPYDRSRRDDPWKGGKYNAGQTKDNTENNNREEREYRPAPPSNDMEMGDNMEVKEPGLENVEYCKLLKRGKYICTVNARYVRGDPTCRLPELLDVNQRANPERLKNCLGKSVELSLWKLGAESKEDNPKYESLCDYLISKNRVALVQEGPFDVYIVPPHKQFENLLNTPDSDFMYAYLLPRAP